MEKTVNKQITQDILRAVVMAATAAELIGYTLSASNFPPGVNQNIVKQTIDQLDKYVREIRRATGETGTHFDKKIRSERLFDIAGVVDLINRIGIEEKQQSFDDMVGLIIDTLHAILYSQKHRKNLYYPKYRALFDLFIQDVKAEVNKEPKKFLFNEHGELFMRVHTEQPEPKLDNND